MPAEAETSEDAVLGGRLVLRQPRAGHRVGHDAILLAAAISARAGDHAVDLGAGVGAAGLALAQRIDGLAVTLVEIDPALAALAGENVARNGLGERVRAVCLDVVAPAAAFAAAGLPPGTADRVLMNPPFNAAQNPSPDRGRRLAHVAANETLRGWLDAAARLLRPQAAVTLIWRADGLDAVLAALADGFGARHPVAALSKARCGGNSGARPRGQGKPCAAVVAAGLHARRRGGKSHRRGASGTPRKRCVSLGW